MAQVTTLRASGLPGPTQTFAPKTAAIVAVADAKVCLGAQYDSVLELNAQYDAVIEREGLVPGCEANVPRTIATAVDSEGASSLRVVT